jgi:hypothetical protein
MSGPGDGGGLRWQGGPHEWERAVANSGLLRRLDGRWNDLLASYAGLAERELLEPGVAGTWSVRDLVAHVTTWEEEALTHLPAILAGRRPPRYSVTHGGINAFNAAATTRNRDLPLAEVLRRRDDVHRRLVDFIQGVPDAALGGETPARRRLRLDTYGHYAVHANAIRKWRERRTGR